MDIICIKLVVLKHLMPHIKFPRHRPFDSREEDFLRFLPYMDVATLVIYLDRLNKLLFPHPMEAPYEI